MRSVREEEEARRKEEDPDPDATFEYSDGDGDGGGDGRDGGSSSARGGVRGGDGVGEGGGTGERPGAVKHARLDRSPMHARAKPSTHACPDQSPARSASRSPNGVPVVGSNARRTSPRAASGARASGPSPLAPQPSAATDPDPHSNRRSLRSHGSSPLASSVSPSKSTAPSPLLAGAASQASGSADGVNGGCGTSSHGGGTRSLFANYAFLLTGFAPDARRRLEGTLRQVRRQPRRRLDSEQALVLRPPRPPHAGGWQHRRRLG